MNGTDHAAGATSNDTIDDIWNKELTSGNQNLWIVLNSYIDNSSDEDGNFNFWRFITIIPIFLPVLVIALEEGRFPHLNDIQKKYPDTVTEIKECLLMINYEASEPDTETSGNNLYTSMYEYTNSGDFPELQIL